MYGDFGRAQITVGFKVIFHQVNIRLKWIIQLNWTFSCQVIYANKLTRLVILRCRHSAQDLLSSCIPLLDKVGLLSVFCCFIMLLSYVHIILLFFEVRKDSVIARLLYTGATIRLVENHIQTQTSFCRHCHLFMVKRQKKILESLKSVPKEDMEEKILDLQRIDAFWSLGRLIFPFSREGC